MYELYEEMISAYRTGNDDVFIPAARKWFQLCKKNPFILDTEAHEAFFQAERHFGYWADGGINSRVSKQRFIEALRQIAQLETPNPHKKGEPIEEEKKEPKHVLGVLPEKGITAKNVRIGGWKLSSEAVTEKKMEELKEELKAEIKEELKEEESKEEKKTEEPKKGIFGRNKKR